MELFKKYDDKANHEFQFIYDPDIYNLSCIKME